MALSRIVYDGDGVTTQFAIPFSLGYIRQEDITCRVGDEVDGLGDPVYRAMTFISPELVDIAGTGPIPGEVAGRVVFTRTVERDGLLVDYEDGAIINEVNMNTAQKQALMLVHEVLDGRFEAFQADLDLGGFRVTNVGDPQDAGDLITLGYAQENAGNAVSAAAAAAASASAASGSASSSSSSAAASASSASAASTSASTATTKAAEAAASASAASTSASTAGTHASTATTQAGVAITKAGEAETARAASVVAKDASVAAKDIAVASASTATTKASEASASAAAALVSENNVSTASVPVGMVFFSPKGTVPGGYLALEGGSFDSGVYPALFTYLGTTTLPDYRDRVLRGAGTLAGAVGTFQEDAMQRITGKSDSFMWAYPTAEGAISGETGTAASTYGVNGATTRKVTFDSGNSPGARVSDVETRVKAAIGKFVIKAYQAIVDGGTADLVAIEAAQQYMVRFDAQVLTQTQQWQARKNIGMDLGHPLLHMQGQAPSGTDGGSTIAGQQTRVLNTVVVNEITGATLSSNAFFLPEGTYHIKAQAPGYNCSRHRLFIVFHATGVGHLVGPGAYSRYTGEIGTPAHIETRMVVPSGGQTYRLTHYTQVVQPINGLGVSASTGDLEMYADLKIWKLK